CGVECQTCAFTQQFEVDFISRISGSMVVGMESAEVKDDRNAMFCKVVLVGSIIDSHGILWIVVHIVQFQLGIGCIRLFINGLQFGTELIGADGVNIVVVSV